MFSSDNGQKFLKICAICGLGFFINAELSPGWLQSQEHHLCEQCHIDSHTHEHRQPVTRIMQDVVGLTTTGSGGSGDIMISS